MKKVRKSARPITTWLGGVCCKAKALRVKESTTTMRTKAVVMIIIDGASAKMVSRSKICRLVATSCGSSAVPTPIWICGNTGCAQTVPAAARSSVGATSKKKNPARLLFIFFTLVWIFFQLVDLCSNFSYGRTRIAPLIFSSFTRRNYPLQALKKASIMLKRRPLSFFSHLIDQPGVINLRHQVHKPVGRSHQEKAVNQ